MPLTIQDLETELTEEQALDEILERLDSAGFPATSWQKFSIPRIMVHIGAHILSKLTSLVAFLSKMGYNETSEGAALERFSLSHYGNTIQAAVSTQGRFVLACAATEGPHTINVGDVVITDANGNTYRNVEGLAVVYPATLASSGTLALLFEAEVAGEAANIANNQTLTLVTTLAGVTATNPVVPSTSTWITQVGIDKESDPALRTRNSSTWGLLTEFEIIDDTIEALILRGVPALSQVGIDSNNPRGEFTVDVYVAGETTVAGLADVALALTVLEGRAFGSDRFHVDAAPEAAMNLTGTVYFDSKHGSAAVQSAVEDALLEYIKTIPLGGEEHSPGPSNVVPKNNIESVIKETTINGLKAVRTVVLTVPAADLSVASFGKVTRGTYTLTYTPVS
jgi:Baseplate J-like protein